MATQKKSSSKRFELDSKLWVWPFWAGAFFALGYSITKSIFLPKIFTEQSTQTSLNLLKTNKKLLDQKNTLIEGNNKKINSQKIIYVPTSEDSFIRLNINYSEKDNSKKQEIFQNSYGFFQKENIESLIKTLTNTKKTKSSKIKTDYLDS